MGTRGIMRKVQMRVRRPPSFERTDKDRKEMIHAKEKRDSGNAKVPKSLFVPVGITLLMLLAWVSCGHGQESRKIMSFPQRIQKARPAVVEVFVGGNRSGTGFFVSPKGHILTAFHVVGSSEIKEGRIVLSFANNIEVRLDNGKRVSAQPAPNAPTDFAVFDFAVIKADLETPDYLRLGNPEKLVAGDDVYLMGFPFDAPDVVTYRGTVSARLVLPTRFKQGERPIMYNSIHVQAPVAKGFSGAPLISEADDRVVGVITNKLGGINPKLADVRGQIEQAQRVGTVEITGVDPLGAMLELINVLDLYLSAGTGWAVSVEHVSRFVAREVR